MVSLVVAFAQFVSLVILVVAFAQFVSLVSLVVAFAQFVSLVTGQSFANPTQYCHLCYPSFVMCCNLRQTCNCLVVAFTQLVSLISL